jgi:hypothetical protein
MSAFDQDIAAHVKFARKHDLEHFATHLQCMHLMAKVRGYGEGTPSFVSHKAVNKVGGGMPTEAAGAQSIKTDISKCRLSFSIGLMSI